MKTNSFLFIALIILISACSNPKEEALNRIKSLEEKLFNSNNMEVDRVKALQIVDAYVDFAESYPQDTLSPNYLFKAGDIAMNMKQAGRAISIFNKLMTTYPSFRKADESLFLIGFIYENNMQDFQKAGKIYKSYLQRYPDSDFADDAQSSLDNLGKTPEQLIKEFEAKQKN